MCISILACLLNSPHDTSSRRTNHAQFYATGEERSRWFCRYGFLINDVVGTHPASQLRHCRTSHLIANALYFLHVGLMAALLGGWAVREESAVQLALLLAVKAVWVQYMLAVRPYASVITLVMELAPSLMEVLILVFAFIQREHIQVSSSTFLFLFAWAHWHAHGPCAHVRMNACRRQRMPAAMHAGGMCSFSG